MAQLLGLSGEQVARICPLFPKERRCSGWMTGRCCAASSLSFRRGCAGWMPLLPMAPTKTSTTVAAAGETRVFLI